MEHKKLIGIPLVYILTLIYAVMSTTTGILLNNGLIIFLGWNVILATLVYFLSQMFVLSRTKKHPFWMSYGIFILFILFFPNAFYLLTDTIHFQAYTFFESYPTLYALGIEDWIVFSIVTVGMLYGVKLGISAIDHMKHVEFSWISKHRTSYLFILFILSSIGIYLGRFIRLNSWNIFDIQKIVFGILDHFAFFVQFVLLFTLIQGFCYFLFSSKTKILYNQTIESEE